MLQLLCAGSVGPQPLAAVKSPVRMVAENQGQRDVTAVGQRGRSCEAEAVLDRDGGEGEREGGPARSVAGRGADTGERGGLGASVVGDGQQAVACAAGRGRKRLRDTVQPVCAGSDVPQVFAETV